MLERIFGENDKTAAANRAAFAASGVRAVNLMSSPGAGKTTLLRETLSRLAGLVRIGIIEGDIETSLDADRLAGLRRRDRAHQHRQRVRRRVPSGRPDGRLGAAPAALGQLDLVLIENVGNLVCPAEFDVGQDARAMVYAITEGEEKPLKYPVMFRSCELVVVNKMDLLPYLDFDLDGFVGNLREVNPAARGLVRQRPHRRGGRRLVRLAPRPAAAVAVSGCGAAPGPAPASPRAPR